MTVQNVDENFICSLLKSPNYFSVVDLIDNGSVTNDLFLDGYFPFDSLFENSDADLQFGNPEKFRACVFALLDRGMRPNPLLLKQINLKVAIETRTLLYLIMGYHLEFKSIGILHNVITHAGPCELHPSLLGLLLALGVDIEERYGAEHQTVLEFCFANLQVSRYFIERLIANGADCSIIDHTKIQKHFYQKLVSPYLRMAVAHGMRNDFGYSEDELERDRLSVHVLQMREFDHRAVRLCVALSARDLPVLVTMALLEATVEIARFVRWSYRWNFVLLVKQSRIAHSNND